MATGDGWMHGRLNLACVSVPVVVLTLLVFIGFSLFVSGTIFTGIGYTKKRTQDELRGTSFMKELGPALIVIGLVTTLLCAFGVYAARRMLAKVPARAQPTERSVSQVVTSNVVDNDLYSSSTEPINAARRDREVIYQNISETHRYSRSYSNERLEPIRPPRPPRRQRQPTPPEVRDQEVNEVPPSYEEVMSEVLHPQNN